MLGSNRDNLGKSLPSPVSLNIPRGEYVSGHVFCPFASDTSQGELMEKGWENAVKGLGKIIYIRALARAERMQPSTMGKKIC